MSYTQQLARLGQDTLANLEALYPGQFVQGMFYEVTDKDTYGIGLGDNSLSLLMTGFDLTDDASQVLTVGHKDVINFEGLNKLKTVKKSDGIQFDFDLTGADDYSVLTKNGTSVEWLKPLTVAANSTSLISISANNEISISQLLAFTKTYDHVATSLADWITTSGYDGTQDTDLLVLDNVSDGNGGVKLEMWMQVGSAGTAADFVLTSVDVTDAYVKALLSGGEGVAYNNTTGAISLSYLRKTGTNVEFNDGTTWDKIWTQNEFGTADVANWNTAYGWGNHSGLYSVLGHTHTIADITDLSATDVANWNTAYGWGNHSGLYSVLGHTHTLSQITDLNSTTDLSEGTNLYYTNARVQSFVNKNYIDNLGVDAATLGGYAASHYLNPSNLSWGLTTNYLPIFNGTSLINSIASQSGTEFRVAGLIRAQANDTGTFFKSLNSVGVGFEQFYIKHNLANVEIGNSRGKLSLLSNTTGASLELGTQLTSTTNVLISKPNAWLTLDTDSAAPSAEQTTGITIGESASAALHLIYTGDGYGYIGMGALTNNLPTFKSIRFNHLSDVAMFYATPNVNGYDVMHKGNDGANSGFDADLLDGQHGSYYTNTSNMIWGLTNTKLPYFNGTTLVDSIVSQSGTVATVNGDVTISGNVTFNNGAGSYNIGGIREGLKNQGVFELFTNLNHNGIVADAEGRITINQLGSSDGLRITRVGCGGIRFSNLSSRLAILNNTSDNELMSFNDNETITMYVPTSFKESKVNITSTSSIGEITVKNAVNAISTRILGSKIETSTINASEVVLISSINGLQFEDVSGEGKHRITHNDGGGDFNLRVGNKFSSGSGTISTETGYSFHQKWMQDTGSFEHFIYPHQTVGNSVGSHVNKIKYTPTYFATSNALAAGTDAPNLANNVKLVVAGGLITGGTYITSYRNLLDLSSSNIKAQSIISTPLGSNFRFEEDGVNNDAWFYIKPYTTSRAANIIATNSGGMNVGTNSNVPVNFIVNNAARFSLTSTLATINAPIKGNYYADGFDDSTVVAAVVGLKTDGTFIRKRMSDFANQIIDDSITPSTRTVTATAHGLSQFDVVYFDGTAFQKAIATDLDNARKANEVVIEVIDTNTIKVAGSGYVKSVAHGFDVDGLSYALSTTTAGAVVKEDTLTLGTDTIWRVFRAVDVNTLNIQITQIAY